MIMIVWNPNYINPKHIEHIMKQLKNSSEVIVDIPHVSKDALPIYISDGRISGVKNETNI